MRPTLAARIIRLVGNFVRTVRLMFIESPFRIANEIAGVSITACTVSL